MAEEIKTPMSDFDKVEQVKDTAEFILLQDGANARVEAPVIEQKIIDKIDSKYLLKKEIAESAKGKGGIVKNNELAVSGNDIFKYINPLNIYNNLLCDKVIEDDFKDELSDSIFWIDKKNVIKKGELLVNFKINFKYNSNRLFLALCKLEGSNYTVVRRIEINKSKSSYFLNELFDDYNFEDDIYLALYSAGGNKSVIGRKNNFNELFYSSNLNDVGSLANIKNFELSMQVEKVCKKDINKLNLPKFLYTVAGNHIQIFKSNILKNFDYFNYYVKVTSNKNESGSKMIGNDYLRYFECFVNSTGDFDLKFDLYNNRNQVIDTKIVTVIVKNKPLTIDELFIMFCGDSLTMYNRIPDEVKRLLSTSINLYTQEDTLSPQQLSMPKGSGFSNVNLLGTQKYDFKGWVGKEYNEGYSGYTSKDFITNVSPFWKDGLLNFTKYCEINNITKMDYFIFGIGWNDITKVDYSKENTKQNIITLFNNIKIKFPNIKFLLWSENMPSVNGGTGSHPWGADKRVNLIEWRNRMFEVHEIMREISIELSNVIYVDSNSQFDSNFGCQFENYPTNFRVRTIEKIGKADVHPNDSGFFQISSVIYNAILNNLGY